MLFYHLLGTPYLLPDGRIDDQYLIAVLIEIEIFDALIEETGTVYNAALEAVSYQYHNRYCKGSCPSLKEQLEWMDGMQAWREREGRPLPNPARSMPDAAKAIAGYNDGDGFQALWWANPYRGSEMANYINENHGDVPYQGLIVDGSEFIVGFRGREDDPLTSDVLDFVVVTKEQDDACNITKPTCMGFP